MEHVAELRNEYKWLLFFSVPKLLLLYHLLQDQNLGAIVHEISFLFSNTQSSWESAVVEVNSRRGEGGIGIEGEKQQFTWIFQVVCSSVNLQLVRVFFLSF